MRISDRTILTTFVVTVVAAAVIAGLVLIGSPGEERLRRLDARRVADLRTIVNSIEDYWRRHDRLPTDLTDFATEPDLSPHTRDPETDNPYEYRALDSTSYELCSVFNLPAVRSRTDADFWFHADGRQCFFLEMNTNGD
ncbi:MAG: hypothetical protein KJO98_07255 [Rhodothermia bacterium]|nr:hypothetical protein [Rhodothermia bacterium]